MHRSDLLLVDVLRVVGIRVMNSVPCPASHFASVFAKYPSMTD